jgi:hypothetical protein
MARIPGRQVRSGVADALLLPVRVKRENKAKAAKAADALGISMAAYVDALLDREELGEDGRPMWWTQPVAADQEELPLKSA